MGYAAPVIFIQMVAGFYQEQLYLAYRISMIAYTYNPNLLKTFNPLYD